MILLLWFFMTKEFSPMHAHARREEWSTNYISIIVSPDSNPQPHNEPLSAGSPPRSATISIATQSIATNMDEESKDTARFLLMFADTGF
jgi:hypothetical protein